MATISSAGIGSGLDVNGIVSQLMTLERQPLTALARSEAGLQAKLSAYGTLKGALSAVQSSISDLKNISKFNTPKASVGDASIMAVSATSIAVEGSYAVEVKQLASAQKLASKAFADITTTVGTGTLSIQVGSGAAQNIAIGVGQSSLAGIRDAINEAKVGVQATLLNDGTGYRLALTAQSTGTANGIKLTISGDGDALDLDDAGLSQLAYDAAGSPGNGKNLTETVAAQDAILKVDGIDNITKASNTVTDVIQGVTLNLQQASAADTSTVVSVTRDSATVKAAAEGFVKAYNDLDKIVKDLTFYNPETRERGALQGDNSVHRLLSQVRSSLTRPLPGLSGAYNLLSQVGIGFDIDGKLALDGTKFQEALDNNFYDIGGLFATQGRAEDSLLRYVSATSNTVAGTYDVRIDALATQGKLTGTGTAALADSVTAGTFDTPFVIDANNDTFSVKVDGVQSATVTLTQNTYTTAAELAAEIQAKINGDSALKDAGIAVAVSFETAADRLVLLSNGYGTTSAVEITVVDTNTATALGWSVGAGIAGTNVAGSINGVAAVGDGRLLTAGTSSPASGLSLEVTGGALGARGTASYSHGHAHQLDKLLDNLLAATGPIASRTEGLNSSVEDINDRREVLERRLIDIEQRFRQQFIALDQLLSQMRATSDYLTQQLSNLPTVGSGG